ncbi:MAG: hypothetical protein WAN61_00540 [Minisyncoccia bacterium]
MISQYLDKNNLHHAYLIQGEWEAITAEIIKFLDGLNIKTAGNPDFIHINLDSFKVEDAFYLRSMSTDKSFSSAKKIFLICVNSFTLDAQNVLLKMFEEPIENTNFFVIVPDAKALLKTFVSRFYFIPTRSDLAEYAEAEKFIAMPLQKRIDFIKEFLPKKDEEDKEEMNAESNNSKALKFLNALETSLHSKLQKNSEWCGSHPVLREGLSQKNSFAACCAHFFKVREFLRMPGSSVKTLMESVALITPIMLQ